MEEMQEGCLGFGMLGVGMLEGCSGKGVHKECLEGGILSGWDAGGMIRDWDAGRSCSEECLGVRMQSGFSGMLRGRDVWEDTQRDAQGLGCREGGMQERCLERCRKDAQGRVA